MRIIKDEFFILKSDSPYNAAGLIDIKYKWCAPKLRFRWMRFLVKRLFRERWRAPKIEIGWIKSLVYRCHVYYKWLLWLLYGISLKNIERASVIICFDERSDFFMCWLFSRCYSKKRRIVYCWNILDEEEAFRLKQLDWELWSFDQCDCQKYGMKYNKPFNAAALTKTAIQLYEKPKDVFFIGKDKGRKERIDKIKKYLENLGISTKFVIVDTKLKKRKKVSKTGYSPPMAYSEILYEVQQSKAILDVHILGEEGISQREMEALFYKKKLITTRVEIKNRDFYNPKNIFIIDVDFLNIDIASFLMDPIVDVEEDIMKSYSFEEWITRFLEG